MKKKIFIPLVTIAFLLIGIRVGTTSAYFISEDKVTNNFQNGDVDIEIEEPNFNPPNSGWSGWKVDKKVQVKNESTVPILVRVSIIPSWSNDEDGDSPFLGDVSDNVIKLNFKDEEGNSNLIQSITDEQGNLIKEKWIKGNDGYYYYTSALEIKDEKDEGKNKTSVLLQSVEATINASTVGQDFVSLYEDKYLQVDVKSEAIQISDKSYEKLWNINDETISGLLDKIINEYKANENGDV